MSNNLQQQFSLKNTLLQQQQQSYNFLNLPQEILNYIIECLSRIDCYNLSRTCKKAKKIFFNENIADFNTRSILVIEAMILPKTHNVIEELLYYWFDLDKIKNSNLWMIEHDRILNFNTDPYYCHCLKLKKNNHSNNKDDDDEDDLYEQILTLKKNFVHHVKSYCCTDIDVFEIYRQNSSDIYNIKEQYDDDNNISDDKEKENTVTTQFYYEQKKTSTVCKDFTLRILLCILYCQMNYVIRNNNLEKFNWYITFTGYLPTLYHFNYAVMTSSMDIALNIFEHYLINDENMGLQFKYSTLDKIGCYGNEYLLNGIRTIYMLHNVNNHDPRDNLIENYLNFNVILIEALKFKNDQVVLWIIENIDFTTLSFLQQPDKNSFAQIFITLLRSGYYDKCFKNLEQKSHILKFNKLRAKTIDFENKQLVFFPIKSNINAVYVNALLINGNPLHAWKLMWKYGIQLNESIIVSILRLWHKITYLSANKQLLVESNKGYNSSYENTYIKFQQTKMILKSWRLYILSYPLQIYKSFKVLAFAALFKDELFVDFITTPNNNKYKNITLGYLQNLIYMDDDETEEDVDINCSYYNNQWNEINNDIVFLNNLKFKKNYHHQQQENYNQQQQQQEIMLDNELKFEEQKEIFFKNMFKKIYNGFYNPVKMLFTHIPLIMIKKNEEISLPTIMMSLLLDDENNAQRIIPNNLSITTSIECIDDANTAFLNSNKYYYDYSGNKIADYGLKQTIPIDLLLFKLKKILCNLLYPVYGDQENDDENLLSYTEHVILSFACLNMDGLWLLKLINPPYNFQKNEYCYIACLFHNYINTEFLQILIDNRFPICKFNFLQTVKNFKKLEWKRWFTINEHRLNIID